MWNSRWYSASEPLRGVLAGVWSVNAPASSHLSARVLPDGTTCLTFLRDQSELRTSDNGWSGWSPAALSGPRTKPFDMRLSAAGRMFIVQLNPAAGRRVFGVPMSALKDQHESLEAINLAADEVMAAVQSDAPAGACVRAIEQWLWRLVRTREDSCQVTRAAVEAVSARSGLIRVHDLAEQLDLSRRHLNRVMLDRVGFTPKQFARITRFHFAVQLGRMNPAIPLTKIALDAGYSDQAHMTREFVELGGIRPTELRSEAAATIW